MRPIHALQDGVARIGAGAFDQQIDIRTGDELENLADGFQPHECSVGSRNAGLAEGRSANPGPFSQALEQQTATAEVLRVIASSPTDLQHVWTLSPKARRGCARRETVMFLLTGDVRRISCPRACADPIVGSADAAVLHFAQAGGG